MKKKVLFLTALLLFVLTVPAYAVQPRLIRVVPSISFSNSNATCTATIIANNSTDEIEVYVEVWEEDALHASWSDEGTGSLTTSRTVSAYRGRGYTLKVYATVNGDALDVASTYKRCPWSS